MLNIHDSHHIPTNRCVFGHRICRTNTGVFQGVGELRRVRHEIITMINRRFRFAWQVGQWVRHEDIVKKRTEAL